ncbi:MAG TPA: choice-of-anchor P family protein [Nocardioidaceae bacterium]|nr:choice-of-anchor P family protein [Nocardioidaceae bacterium]
MFNARIPLATAFAAVLTTTALTASPVIAKPPGGGGGGTTNATSYSGSAVVVDAQVGLLGGLFPKLVDLQLSDVGPLPSTGGFDHDHLLQLGADGPPLWLDAHVASASTAGSGDRAHSAASVADIFVGLGALSPDTLSIRAGLLRSSTLAKCGATGAELSGRANIVDLTITAAGVPYPINLAAPANTSITVPGVARITINEQIVTANSITVNALHVETLSPLDAIVDADVVISQSHSDINCQGGDNPPPPPPCQVLDFVTGGGQIVGKNTSFGMVGGQKPNGLSGHFNLVDKNGSRTHIKAGTVDTYTVVNTTTRRLVYSGTVNGTPAKITVTVADNGEPGTNDTITVSTSTGYTNGTAVSGNIQLHKPVGCGGGGKKGGRP